ncbi:MAG: hypothetical protein K9H14_06210 [Actinomycetia bacterium]|nr:hypothetical protein [Actinomycetes bacterium]
MEVKCDICGKVFDCTDEDKREKNGVISNTVGGGKVIWICPECSTKTNHF